MVAFCVCTIIGITFSFVLHLRILDNVDKILFFQQINNREIPMTTSWPHLTPEGVVTKSVTTERRYSDEGGWEDVDAWLNRHQEEVDAAKARWPVHNPEAK